MSAVDHGTSDKGHTRNNIIMGSFGVSEVDFPIELVHFLRVTTSP